MSLTVFDLPLDKIVLLVCMSLFTTVAAMSDIRTRRIPNKLTMPVFLAGIIYQIVFHQWSGMLDALQGFGVGFGTLFVLWIIGGGGGGDVKLMGALSVWLGFKMTLAVLVLSTTFVLIGTLGVMIYSTVVRGIMGTRAKYLAKRGETGVNKKGLAPRQQRRVMAYAVPVALATWVVLIFMIPKWPHREAKTKQGETGQQTTVVVQVDPSN